MKKELSPKQNSDLLLKLISRFEKNMNRHKGIEWSKVQSKLLAKPEKLWSLNEMENTGGEPDLIAPFSAANTRNTGEFIFCDCSPETPAGRRSFCYDTDALHSRKEHKPKNSAIGMATSMGIELFTEEQYRELQKLGKFDSKTSSWLRTPSEIRELGGAIFGDLRYGRVFVYHNGAESYYSGRGFRGLLLV